MDRSILRYVAVFFPFFITGSALYAPGQSFRPVAAAPIELRETVPSKIFTPNGDGINDVFRLFILNPSGSVMSQKTIFNLSGFEVADFMVVGDETASTVELNWNGKDKSGEDCPSGIYIYQLQSEGTSINGTMVVAK